MSQCPPTVLRVRNGLSRIAELITTSKPVTVAFLGGSITVGGGSSDRNILSYRAITTAWLREKFPSVEFTSVNAGVGGTASDYGAFRVQRDALSQCPDLMFVEFAVNDSACEPEIIMPAMEGIVRQAMECRNDMDIVFIYTLKQDYLPIYERGELPVPTAKHEKVADHYGFATIDLAAATANILNHSRMQWDDFSKDTCHPTDRAHKIYADHITKALEQMIAKPGNKPEFPINPLTDNAWSNTRMRVIPADSPQTGSWQQIECVVDPPSWKVFEQLLCSDHVGREIHIPFTGQAVGVVWQIGPNSGDIDVAIDDQPYHTERPFDKFCVNCERPHYRMLFDNLDGGEHALHIRVSDTADKRSKGRWVRIGHILERRESR